MRSILAIFLILVLVMMLMVLMAPPVINRLAQPTSGNNGAEKYTNSIITEYVGGPIRGYFDQLYDNRLMNAKKIDQYMPDRYNVARTFPDDVNIGLLHRYQ